MPTDNLTKRRLDRITQGTCRLIDIIILY